MDNKVKKNPTTMTDRILKISILFPILPVSGNVINDGTKNTGNHLANKVAPGCKKDMIFRNGLTMHNIRNTIPQAPKLLGKVI